jgi:hypothetical protein
MTSSEPTLTPVRFSRLSRRGVLLGLSPAQLACLGIGAIALLAGLYTAGGTGAILTAPIWATAAAAAWVPVAGQPAIAWAPVTGQWLLRRAHKQTSYRRRITRPRPAGTLALPGDAAALRLVRHEESGAAMIHDPHAATLTGMLEIRHRAFLLLDPGEQERRAHAWGRVLATVCRSTRIHRLQVLERTLPDTGTGLAEWWRREGVNDDDWPSRVYSELIGKAGPAGERHVTIVALSLDLRAASRAIRAVGGGMKGAAEVLRQDLETLTTALRSANLNPTAWYTAEQVAVVLRTAYDPAATATLDRHPNTGRDLSAAGPVAVEERWDRMRTDTAHHAVFWISEWPRSEVYPGFLSPLLLTSGVRRAVTLIYDPVRPDVAARSIRRQKVGHASDAAQRAKIGQIEDASITAEYADVLQREADLTRGHGILRRAGFIAISGTTVDELDAGCAVVEQAAIQASLETRRAYGQQSQAFAAAALPLCRGI